MPPADPADLQREIAALAYQYWVEEGCPENEALRHWERAERELHRRHGDSLAEGHAPGGVPEDTSAAGKLG